MNEGTPGFQEVFESGQTSPISGHANGQRGACKGIKFQRVNHLELRTGGNAYAFNSP